MPELSLVIVSYNTREYLDRCLRAVTGHGYEVIVVDNASTDGSARLVRAGFGEARLFELPVNLGFGAAANHGLEQATARYILLMNPDAWPRDHDAIERLVACAENDHRAGVVGPSLVGRDGGSQASLVGLPSRWWLGAPAVSSTTPGRLRSLTLRPRSPGQAFLVGAVLLLRREALEEVGGFDTDFFMFGEEVDLCARMQRAQWQVRLCSEAVFVHVGGAATRYESETMYREQVRGHLRVLSKREGLGSAETARRLLRVALRFRALLAVGKSRNMYRETASWLASADVRTLLATPGRSSRGHRGGSEDRTSDSAD